MLFELKMSHHARNLNDKLETFSKGNSIGSAFIVPCSSTFWKRLRIWGTLPWAFSPSRQTLRLCMIIIHPSFSSRLSCMIERKSNSEGFLDVFQLSPKTLETGRETLGNFSIVLKSQETLASPQTRVGLNAHSSRLSWIKVLVEA